MKIQEAIVAALKPLSFVKKIILFGSRARGDHQTKSDYDIAVDCPNARWDEWIEVVEAIEKIPTLYAIQVVRLDTSCEQLQQEIAKEGVTLYAR